MPDIQELGEKSKGGPVGNTKAKDASRIWDAIHYALQQEYKPQGVKRGDAMKAIMIKVVQDALDGDKAARDFLAERYEGKVAQKTEMSGPNGSPIQTQDVPIIINGVKPKK